ncbi:hypothetical protein EZV62_012861 [Acer yangbiense]|uniref:Nudix hydrolase domain-containing protein n=1 Tax=Acer yangbiense TaxID=1000413 RepID=A0A5C7HXD7_9ROSI|nr:hypothetical protein EZV62_012861 [Acer yangbiense]
MATLLNGSLYSGFYDCQSFLKKKHRTSWPNMCSFQRLSMAKFDWLSISFRVGGNLFTKKGINVLSPEITVPSFAPEFLDAIEDEYNGVIIDPESLPSSANAFVSALRASLSYWKSKGKKGVWLKILPEQADLVPVALQEGFSYHHAEPGYVMLTHWIPGERCSGVWKSPTGYINKSEEIFSAAIREVKEETGVDTIFQQMAAFRYSTFENSDILFVCMLEPLSSEITIDDKEIQDAKWMPLDEFVGQSFYVDDHMSRKVIDVCVKAYEDRYNGFVARHLTSKLDGKLSCLYYSSD